MAINCHGKEHILIKDLSAPPIPGNGFYSDYADYNYLHCNVHK